MIVPSDKSKRFQDNYYLKYIHQQNKRLLQNQKEALERFIPEQEAEKNSFGERFKVYMEKLNQQEIADEENKRIDKMRKLKALYDERSQLGESSRNETITDTMSKFQTIATVQKHQFNSISEIDSKKHSSQITSPKLNAKGSLQPVTPSSPPLASK